ncbi:MAG: 2-octaprenyl-6-methoxyphenyl hydroxylase, partial [Gammaproteobacteria bacterium]|nr:2-octaprenyl-6-methoxyphenyl hydroxylase [Gammaproteobacteria bacterium]
MQRLNCDIAIVGGGMVGASLARALSDLPVTVALVEKNNPTTIASNQSHASFDQRTTALSLGSRKVFETLGVWSAIDNQATAIYKIHVSETGRFGVTLINHQEENVPALGYTVSNRVLGQALWQPLVKCSQLNLLCPATVDGLTHDQGVQMTVHHQDGEQSLRAKLLVVADGAHSQLRDQLSVTASKRNYQQTASVAVIEAERPQVHVAFERFFKHGAIALLPVQDDCYGLVFVRDSTSASSASADADILACCRQQFGDRLGEWQLLSEFSHYPLALINSQTLIAERAVIIGNAAQTLHPIAAQGFNLALRDVASLAETIAEHI